MNASPPTIIAIDGPAASGKGTLARRLAEYYGFAHLDTGGLYRAVGLAVLRQGGDPADSAQAIKVAQALDAAQLAGLMADPALRSEPASDAASKVAAVPAVRQALYDFQRRFAAAPPNGAPGAVLDGRDIGTVICPEAPAKLFITASAEVRATRRVQELQSRGITAIYAAVLEDMKSRDARDSQREVAPLKPADDAFLLDTSLLNADQAFEKAVSFISTKVSALAENG